MVPAAIRRVSQSVAGLERLVPAVSVAIPVAIAGSGMGVGMAVMTVERLFIKYRHKVRRDVLQAILGLRTWKLRGVLAQFIRELVDDECRGGFWCKRFKGLFEERPLGLDLHGAEGDAGNNVIAMLDAALVEFDGDIIRRRVDHMDAVVVTELVAQVIRKFRVQLKQQQGRSLVHLAHNLPGVAAFARSIFYDDAWLGKIKFAGYQADQLLGTRDNGGYLHRAGQEPFKE
jgi:hypothetical protein